MFLHLYFINKYLYEFHKKNITRKIQTNIKSYRVNVLLCIWPPGSIDILWSRWSPVGGWRHLCMICWRWWQGSNYKGSCVSSGEFNLLLFSLPASTVIVEYLIISIVYCFIIFILSTTGFTHPSTLTME